MEGYTQRSSLQLDELTCPKASLSCDRERRAWTLVRNCVLRTPFCLSNDLLPSLGRWELEQLNHFVHNMLFRYDHELPFTPDLHTDMMTFLRSAFESLVCPTQQFIATGRWLNRESFEPHLCPAYELPLPGIVLRMETLLDHINKEDVLHRRLVEAFGGSHMRVVVALLWHHHVFSLVRRLPEYVIFHEPPSAVERKTSPSRFSHAPYYDFSVQCDPEPGLYIFRTDPQRLADAHSKLDDAAPRVSLADAHTAR